MPADRQQHSPGIFWIIAGINGAGKTTFCQRAPIANLLGPITILNADDMTLAELRNQGISEFAAADGDTLRQSFIQAAETVQKSVESHIAQGRSIGVETVLSTPKYVKLAAEAQRCGMKVGMVYVALRSADLAISRVGTRVRAGGHPVPAEKIRQRWERSLDNMVQLWESVDIALLFDNSDSDPAKSPILVAAKQKGRAAGATVVFDAAALPMVTSRLPV